MRASLLLAIVALAAAGAGAACRAGEAHPGPERRFVPAVVRTLTKGRLRWRPRLVLTNPGRSPVLAHVHPWPPVDSGDRTWAMTVPPGARVEVPLRIPKSPSVSSLLVESARPLDVDASVRAVLDGREIVLQVPAIDGRELLKLGDTVVVGPLRQDEAFRAHVGVTVPWSDRDAVPYWFRFKIKDEAGNVLAAEDRAGPGLPYTIDDPWKEFGLPAGKPITLEATLLRSARGRRPILGAWVYGIEGDLSTRQPSFVPYRVLSK